MARRAATHPANAPASHGRGAKRHDHLRTVLPIPWLHSLPMERRNPRSTEGPRMTLAKAAPTDWAKWFAAVTGMPVEKVREKLEMGAENVRITAGDYAYDNNINGPHRNVASASGKGLATELLRRR